MHEPEVRPKLACEAEGDGGREPGGLGGVHQDGVGAAILRYQRARQALMGHAVERLGRGKQRPPQRAEPDLAPASAFALAPALAKHACHFAAGDDLWTCRQQIFQQRAAAVAIASDIDEPGHFGPGRQIRAVAVSRWVERPAYVTFHAKTRVLHARRWHRSDMLAPETGVVAPL